jgi:hypothetical protein
MEIGKSSSASDTHRNNDSPGSSGPEPRGRRGALELATPLIEALESVAHSQLVELLADSLLAHRTANSRGHAETPPGLPNARKEQRDG